MWISDVWFELEEDVLWGRYSQDLQNAEIHGLTPWVAQFGSLVPLDGNADV